MSLKAVSNKSEKQQQQIPLMEYAEIDNSANQSPQHHNLPNGYDKINDDNINMNTGVSVQKSLTGYVHMYIHGIKSLINYYV